MYHEPRSKVVVGRDVLENIFADYQTFADKRLILPITKQLFC